MILWLVKLCSDFWTLNACELVKYCFTLSNQIIFVGQRSNKDYYKRPAVVVGVFGKGRLHITKRNASEYGKTVRALAVTLVTLTGLAVTTSVGRPFLVFTTIWLQAGFHRSSIHRSFLRFRECPRSLEAPTIWKGSRH